MILFEDITTIYPVASSLRVLYISMLQTPEKIPMTSIHVTASRLFRDNGCEDVVRLPHPARYIKPSVSINRNPFVLILLIYCRFVNTMSATQKSALNIVMVCLSSYLRRLRLFMHVQGAMTFGEPGKEGEIARSHSESSISCSP